MRVLYLTFSIVALDQVTKVLVKGFSIPFLGIVWDGMYYGQTIPILGDFIRLTYIENPGMAFGINFGGRTFFAVFSLIACIGIFWYLVAIRKEPLRIRLPLALILGGAFGNLIDRVFYGVFYSTAPLFHGSVVDFIDVIFFNITIFGYNLSRWPVFNIADSAVTVGVILLILLHRNTAKEPEPIPHEDADLAQPPGDSPPQPQADSDETGSKDVQESERTRSLSTR